MAAEREDHSRLQWRVRKCAKETFTRNLIFGATDDSDADILKLSDYLLETPKMVKQLSDLCLGCIQQHLSVIHRQGAKLPTLFKERLIERMAFHDLLHQDNLPFVRENLLCTALQHINLYKCGQVDDHFLRMLAASRCCLEVLVVSGCHSVGDAGVLAITKGQRKLRILQLTDLPCLTSQGLTAIDSPHLWKVEIRKCVKITMAGIKSLVSRSHRIKVLTVSYCNKLERQLYGDVAAALGPVLEDLSLGIPGITDDELCQLSKHCSNLKKLDLSGANKVTMEGLIKLFQGCTNLRNLDLSYCSRLAGASECQVLWTLPQNLKELSLCGIQLVDEQVLVESMQRLRHLTSVRLCGVVAVNDKTLTQIMEHMGHRLEILDLGGAPKSLTNEGLRAVTKHCLNLKELCLDLLKWMDCSTLCPIFLDSQRAANFRKLYLNCRQLDMRLLSLVSMSCHGLTLLDISDVMEVTDDMLFQLAEHCPKLADLSIRACKQVTDKAVCEVVRNCPIKSLVLSGICTLTNQCIYALANHRPDLERLYLNGCNLITPEAVQYLRDSCVGRLYVQYRTHRVPDL